MRYPIILFVLLLSFSNCDREIIRYEGNVYAKEVFYRSDYVNYRVCIVEKDRGRTCLEVSPEDYHFVKEGSYIIATHVYQDFFEIDNK